MLDPLVGGQVLGALSDGERQTYYSALEETLSTETEIKSPLWGDPNRRLYEARETVFAYIQKDKQLIVPASSISPQKNLANQALDVTLDRFHVQRYPGSSQHTIQINFSVEHLVNLAESGSGTAFTEQDVLYGYIVEAVDGQAAPPTGAAIFRGLCIRDELQMKIATIHLADRVEQRILEVLQSDVMKKGLTLLSAANPAFPMVSELVMGATRMFLSRDKNRGIHEVPIGFLINAADADPKLREGSYMLVQGDAEWFKLEDYYWNPQRGRVEHRKLHEELPFNHMIFSIKKSMA
jgi:hypothetical protein